MLSQNVQTETFLCVLVRIRSLNILRIYLDRLHLGIFCVESAIVVLYLLHDAIGYFALGLTLPISADI
jgi:hypothetical protein